MKLFKILIALHVKFQKIPSTGPFKKKIFFLFFYALRNIRSVTMQLKEVSDKW